MSEGEFKKRMYDKMRPEYADSQDAQELTGVVISTNEVYKMLDEAAKDFPRPKPTGFYEAEEEYYKWYVKWFGEQK